MGPDAGESEGAEDWLSDPEHTEARIDECLHQLQVAYPQYREDTLLNKEMVWVQQRLALIDKDKRYERRWELASRLGARLAAQSENGFEYWQNLYDSTFTDEEYEAQEAAELAAKMKILEEQRADRGALMQG